MQNACCFPVVCFRDLSGWGSFKTGEISSKTNKQEQEYRAEYRVSVKSDGLIMTCLSCGTYMILIHFGKTHVDMEIMKTRVEFQMAWYYSSFNVSLDLLGHELETVASMVNLY